MSGNVGGSIVQAAVADRRKLLQAAEELLQREYDGEVPSAEEVEVLHAAGIDDDFKHRQELNRVGAAHRWMAEAGTKKQRATLETKIEKARQERDQKLPKLRQELKEVVERLEGEINALNAAVDVPSEELEAQHKACEHLRSDKLLPGYISREINHRMGHVKRNFQDLITAESNVVSCNARLEILSNPDGHNKQHRTFFDANDLWADKKHNVVNREKITSLKKQVEDELAESQKVVEERKPIFEMEKEAINELRDFYIK